MRQARYAASQGPATQPDLIDSLHGTYAMLSHPNVQQFNVRLFV